MNSEPMGVDPLNMIARELAEVRVVLRLLCKGLLQIRAVYQRHFWRRVFDRRDLALLRAYAEGEQTKPAEEEDEFQSASYRELHDIAELLGVEMIHGGCVLQAVSDQLRKPKPPPTVEEMERKMRRAINDAILQSTDWDESRVANICARVAMRLLAEGRGR